MTTPEILLVGAAIGFCLLLMVVSKDSGDAARIQSYIEDRGGVLLALRRQGLWLLSAFSGRGGYVRSYAIRYSDAEGKIHNVICRAGAALEEFTFEDEEVPASLESAENRAASLERENQLLEKRVVELENEKNHPTDEDVS